jgi:hypothetical protein
MEQTLESTAGETPPAVDPQLLGFVHDRDVLCPGCGYNLRNLRNDRCPECGEQLELGLRLAEPRQAAPIAGLVGLAAGMGLGGLLLVYAVIVMIRMPGVYRGGEWNRFLGFNATGFIVHGVALLLWVRNWRWLRRLNAWPRWLFVAAAWAMPLVFVVLLATYVR